MCLFHHAPRRTDDALDELAAQYADSAIPVFAARDGLTVRLAPRESYADNLSPRAQLLVGDGHCRWREAGGAVEQRLAAELNGDGGRLDDGGFSRPAVAVGGEPGGVVEQAVGEMIGGGLLPQPGDRARQRRPRGIGGGVKGGKAGAGQLSLSAQHRGELARPVAVQQLEQLGRGLGVGKVPGSRGRRAATPTAEVVAHPERSSSSCSTEQCRNTRSASGYRGRWINTAWCAYEVRWNLLRPVPSGNR